MGTESKDDVALEHAVEVCRSEGVSVIGEDRMDQVFSVNLFRRYWAWKFLHNKLFPFFTIDELAGQLQAAVEFRRVNRGAILAGRAEGRQGLLPWTYLNFGGVLDDGTLRQIASSSQDLSLAATWLKNDRSRLMNVGDVLLKEAIQALVSGHDGQGFVDRAMDQLAGTYKRNEIFRYLHAEAKLPDLKSAKRQKHRAWPVPGLAAVVNMIGLVGKELDLHLVHKLKMGLVQVLAGRRPDSYFEVMGDVDGVLDLLVGVAREENRYWGCYKAQFNSELCERFIHPCSIPNNRNGQLADRHRELVREVSSLDAYASFSSMRVRYPALGRFDDPVSLLERLGLKPKTDEEHKEVNAIYWSLAHVVQAGEPEAGLAVSTLILGFWPVLARCFSQLRRNQDPELFFGEVRWVFINVISRVVLSKSGRLTATIAKNTWRDLVELGKREGRFHLSEEESASWEALNPQPSEMDMLSRIDNSMILERLIPLFGEDSDLVVGKYVYEYTHAELSSEHGLTPAAVQKKIKRLVDKAWKSHKK